MLKIKDIELKNRIILAPMAGVSDYPFRRICRKYGCELAYSEMISSEGLVRGNDKTLQYLYKGKEEGTEAGGYVGFQIFGSDPGHMGESAEILEERGANIVDINMGCPVKKVIKTHSGSALMGDLDRMKAIVRSVRAKTKVAFTVKIRAGFGKEVNAVEVAKILEDLGVDGIILHPRTQNQAFSGRACWDLIRQVKESVDIPVIGNGDILTFEDYEKMLQETGCDGVMIGRGSMGKPWVFQMDRNPDYKPGIEEIKKLIQEHYELSINFYSGDKGIREMRKHLGWYTKGLKSGAILRKEMYSLTCHEDLLNILERF